MKINNEKCAFYRDNRRNRFSVKKFAKKYNLEGPLAGNFFKAQYDSYVPEAHKQIGIHH